MSPILDAVKLYKGVSFFTMGFIVNFLQCILYLSVKPINKQLYRKLIYYLNYTIFSQLISCLWLSDSKLTIHISKEDWEVIRKKNGFIIANHSYDVDFLFFPALCDHLGILGNCKGIMKKSTCYVPVIGWCWNFAEYIFLERSFEKDKETIAKQLNEIYDFPDPVWMALSPEGTRFTSKKHKVSVEFAKSRGLNELKYHLTPRTRGFLTCLPVIKKKGVILIDVEMAFTENKNYKPTLMNLIRGKSMDCHIYLRRIPSNEVPDNDEKAAQWLHDLFVRKDKLQASFHETGDFFKKTDIAPLDSIDIKPSAHAVTNFIFWNIISLSLWLSSIIMAVINENVVFIIIWFSILALFYVFASYAIGRTEVSKSSSQYGFSTK